MSIGHFSIRRPARSRQQQRAMLKRALEHVLFGVVPVVASLALLAFQFKVNAVAIDFRVAYWPAASRLLQGMSPYAVSHQQAIGGFAFVYPAFSALVFAPLALVSNAVGQVLDAVLCFACVPAILYTLRVRDWRVYGVSVLWLPVFVGWQSGNVTLLLTLAIALTWRHRDRPLLAGLLTAAAISLKLFVWPLGLWLLATRRWRASAWAVLWGIGINLVSWGLVGFNEIRVFLRLSSEVTTALWRGGYSMMAVAHHLGLGRTGAEAVLLACSATVAAAVLYTGVIRRRDRDALTLAVLLMLVASPLLWSHYFSLLLIPMALSRPRLSLAWAIGVLMWPMPPRQPVFGWEEVLAWSLTALCVGMALTRNVEPADGGRSRDLSAAPLAVAPT